MTTGADTMTPRETLAAIAEHRQRAQQRRTELLAERRRLSVEALSGAASITAKVAHVAGEIRAIDVTIEDLELTEQQARQALQREMDAASAGQRTADIGRVADLLRARNAVAAEMDGVIDRLVALERQFDALDLEAHGLATRYGRHETLAFLRPQAAVNLVFDRLASLEGLAPLHAFGSHVPRDRIGDISARFSHQTWGHLEQFLPGRVAAAPAEIVSAGNAAVEPVTQLHGVAAQATEPFVPDPPIEGDDDFLPAEEMV